MSGSIRPQRSAMNNYDDLATPRVSNNSGGFHASIHPSGNSALDYRSNKSPETNGRRHRSTSRHSHDAFRMQHYQYQKDPPSKQHRLQHQHRNYSEERQTASECSRGSNLTPRDDSIAHWCTPPRSNTSQLHCAQDPRHDYPGDGSQSSRRSRIKRSQSTGVADMTRMSHQINSSLSCFSKDDCYMRQVDDQDSAKNKSGKGILSRASHKIKKRLVGSNKSSSDSEGRENSVERGRSSSVNISTVQYVREGRDPSPSGGSDEKRQWIRSLSCEQKNNHFIEGSVDVGTGPFYDDQGNLVENFQSADFSDLSTLESNYTHPIGDVVVNSPWTKERQANNNFIPGTPPRVPKVTAGSRSASERPRGQMSKSLSESRQRHSEEQVIGKPQGLEIDGSGSANDDFHMEHTETPTLSSHYADSSSTKSSVSQLEGNVISLEEKLHKKANEGNNTVKLNADVANELERSNKAMTQMAEDLDSYKKECASHRERILQSERENAKMEQIIYNERKKVLSLEAENQMLLNLADEKIGNATSVEKAKDSEMSAYKDQCKKYRDRVIQLEQKLITSESALEATGEMAAALEEDKKALSAALDQRITEAESLNAKLNEKERKLLSTEQELAALQSKWSSANEGSIKRVAGDTERTISVLESENYNLLRKLDAQTSALEMLKKEEDKHRQLESDLNAIKKRNDDLQLNDAELRRQLMDAQDVISNVERLQRSLADSESFISSLQNDLAETRSQHHQQLMEMRSKHIAEIDCISDELQKEKDAKREAEKLNRELEDKILSLEVSRNQLEQQIKNRFKVHAEESSKLMQQLDEMRAKLSASREECSRVQRECADKSRANECLVEELRASGEKQKEDSINTIRRLENNLKAKSDEIEQLRTELEEKVKAVIAMKSDLSIREHQSSRNIEGLNEVIRHLKQDLEVSAEESEVLMASKAELQSQIQAIKTKYIDAIRSLRQEKAALALDIQAFLMDFKTDIVKYVNGLVLGYFRKAENRQLDLTMNHQVALASLKSDQSKMELLLQEERSTTVRLQKAIDSISDEKDERSRIVKALSSKLTVSEKDIIDKIDDLLIEISDSNAKCATLNIDLTTTKSELAKLDHQKHQLLLESDNLKSILEMTTSQMKEMENETERNRSAIASLEQLLADKNSEINQIRDEISIREGKLDKAQSENESLRCNLDTVKHRLEETRNELEVSKNDVVLLNQQMSEKTETIHNLNDILSRASQEAADHLASHYMKIEDELRAQLHSVQCEKEERENQIMMQQDESHVVIEELKAAKIELSTYVDRLSADLDCTRRQITTLELEVGGLRDENRKLIEEHSSSSSKQIQNLTSTIAKLNNVHVSSKREYTAEVSRITDELIQSHNAEIEEANTLISELKTALEDIRSEHKMSLQFYKTELDEKDRVIADLRDNIDEISSSLKSAEQVCSEKQELIKQLKTSLKDALQNALQSNASKRESDDKLAEITDTLSSYDQVEECTSSLSGSLSGVSHLRATIERLIGDKRDLELKLASERRQLLEARSAIAELESKLSTVNQVNEKFQEEVTAQKQKLNQLSDENKERLADQKWLEDRLKTMQSERKKESETCGDLVSRMRNELEKAKQNEEDLKNQIMVLRQDCDIEYLYKELLDKMKDKELKYEAEIEKLSTEKASLFEKNKALLRAYDEANATSSSLAKRLDDANAHCSTLVGKLASVEDEIEALRLNEPLRDCNNDEVSTASSMTSNLLSQTASDLDSTIKAIKKHHLSKLQKLHTELNDVRAKWKRSDQRVEELTKLLQENAKVIDAMHKKLSKQKKQSRQHKSVLAVAQSTSL